MEAMQTADRRGNMQTADHAMNILFSKLDKAIDEMEQGRTQTIEEAWEEIDRI